jgi:riboflavin kinase/FMN adenylyltransferase
VSACRQIDGLENAHLPARPLHLAIGMFDGVHLGHRAVIDTAIQSARRSGGLAGVLTFWPHPSALFNPLTATRLIAGPELRARLLAETGVDFVITQPFTPEFAGIEAEAVLPFLKKHLPSLNTVYVGENWRFGKGRRGDIQMLVAEGRKNRLSVVSAQRINHNGEPISSTRIRACLEAGEIEDANALFGYTYFADGVVSPGKRLGRTIGFPTLNIPWEPALRPRFGVYAVRVSGDKTPVPLPAVANYGVRPTVEQSDQPRIEAHVLTTCPFDAGDGVRVEWLKFLRPEKKFSDVTELSHQFARDRDAAIRYFGLQR